jgi:hypothetical protein
MLMLLVSRVRAHSEAARTTLPLSDMEARVARIRAARISRMGRRR